MQADDAFAFRTLCYCRFLSPLYDLICTSHGPFLFHAYSRSVFSNCVEADISEAR